MFWAKEGFEHKPSRSLKEDRMVETKKWYTWGAAVMASAMILSAGCAQDVGEIDRTQPNKLTKSDFTESGEWYYRQMVVDTDLQGSMVFQGYMSRLNRVRWVVTEETLFACSTVPAFMGERAEQSEIEGEECYGLAAAFPITGTLRCSACLQLCDWRAVQRHRRELLGSSVVRA